MEASSSKLTETESWEIIQHMIRQAKNEVRNDGSYYLLWGWLVFIASLSHYLLGYVLHYRYPYAVWLLMLVGIAGTIYQSVRKSKTQRVKTHMEQFIGSFWLGIFIAIVVVLLGAAFKTGYATAYPVLIAIYGIGTFTSGRLFRFTPLVVGGIVSWAIALIAFFVSFEVQLLLLALTVLVSYLIPGYILKANYRHERV